MLFWDSCTVRAIKNETSSINAVTTTSARAEKVKPLNKAKDSIGQSGKVPDTLEPVFADGVEVGNDLKLIV